MIKGKYNNYLIKDWIILNILQSAAEQFMEPVTPAEGGQHG
jgi:hypothetical protein